LTLEVIPLS